MMIKSLDSLNWQGIHESLMTTGLAVIPNVLNGQECDALRSNYDSSSLYRNVISMERYRFGSGEYKYFNYPLPFVVQQMREEFYARLVPIANSWMSKLEIELSFPERHDLFIENCRAHQQSRPTPLILKYTKGGFNTLHQDLYGDVYFPFQVVVVLSQKGKDYEGGELVFTEQVPRAQSRARAVAPNQGDAVIFTTNFRPAVGKRGYYRAAMKHGISEVTSGTRFALGLIFHDAK